MDHSHKLTNQIEERSLGSCKDVHRKVASQDKLSDLLHLFLFLIMRLLGAFIAVLSVTGWTGRSFVDAKCFCTYSAFVCSDLGVLTNNLRQEQVPSLSPLQHSSKLDWIAMQHTNTMAKSGNCTHWAVGQEKEPEVRLTSDSPFSISNCQVRESVCMVKRMLGCDIFYRLRTSPSNLENMLSNSTHMGCFAKRTGDVVYVTVIYAHSISEAGRPYDGLLRNTTDIMDPNNPDLVIRPNSFMKCTTNQDLPEPQWCHYNRNGSSYIADQLSPPLAPLTPPVPLGSV